ncbi:MAG: ATP-binding protein [bacterium]
MPTLLENLTSDKILVLVGSRQVGKSSLIYLIIESLICEQHVNPNDIFYFNLDDLKLHELFESIPDFIHFVGGGRSRKYLFIDEVQRLSNPGLFLKELYDLHLDLKIICSGSSQLEVKSKLKENLVGRARQFEIQRLSFEEYLEFAHPTTRRQALEEMLIYGSYPAVAAVTQRMEKQLTVKDIYQSYVEKDLVDFLKVDNIQAFNRLLGLLANQIGSLLNIENLCKTARAGRGQIEHYLTILENTFIIRRIYPFFENYKKEITKTPKVYFMDLGLRNFALNNFSSPLDSRTDVGKLFENFYLLELIHQDILGLQKINFWRTTNQTEIDFIVTRGGRREAIEVKWGKPTPPKSFKSIKKHYPDMQTTVVSTAKFVKSW